MKDRIVSIFLGALAVLVAFPLAGLLVKHSEYLWTVSTLLFLPGLSFALLIAIGLSFWKGSSFRLNLSILLISSLFTLYVCELFLIMAGPYITLPDDFDRRNKLEVVMDLRMKGERAVPSIHPKTIIESSVQLGGRDVLPLGGISRRTTVFCNETGKYYIYESDEYGFTNPYGLYSSTATEIALIGDSFTQGFCAHSGSSYAELLRKDFPATLNLGNNGNGPLLELAGIREFLTRIKPRYVFWFYFEGNDIPDLSREIANPILKQYLTNPNFSQDLMGNAEDYDRALTEFAEKEISLESSRTKWSRLRKEFPEKLRLWTRLWHVRALAGITNVKRGWVLRRWNNDVTEEEVEDSLEHILEEAKNTVSSWDGELVFVYLPSFYTFEFESEHPWRERLLKILKGNNIKIIDLLPKFSKERDPISLFNYRKDGHYTSEGNQLVKDEVKKYLLEQGDFTKSKTYEISLNSR